MWEESPEFELFEEDLAAPHSCGHYHRRGTECPTDRTCRSEMCCVPGGDKNE